jgi:hypothetical protein
VGSAFESVRCFSAMICLLYLSRSLIRCLVGASAGCVVVEVWVIFFRANSSLWCDWLLLGYLWKQLDDKRVSLALQLDDIGRSDSSS